jgi:DNA-directed RNA polymerase specialized sigma24 family protein
MISDQSSATWNDNENLSRKCVVLHAFSLRRQFRDVFLLCEIQEMTVAEAAVILNISAELVQTRLDRARREIASRLRNNNGGLLCGRGRAVGQQNEVV